MGYVRKRAENKFQLCVKHKLLQKPFVHTFETQVEADSYGQQLEALLAKGVVPVDLLEPTENISPKVVDVIDLYTEMAPITESDAELLPVVAKEVVGMRVSGITYQWVEAYVRSLKTRDTGRGNLAPGSIRKRVEALARVIDWHLLSAQQSKASNPLRMLPRGYSVYTAQDKKLMPAGVSAKTDVKRDRRMNEGEYEACVRALSGVKRIDRERPLKVDSDFILMFDLILGTGLRLKEAYTLKWEQFDWKTRVIRVNGSKGHRGALKPRTVPLRSALYERLKDKVGSGLVFPFWDGTKEDEKKASKRLTVRFGVLFKYAGLEDFTEHDLRHEACCRWFELRSSQGQWALSDVEICRIMGWSDYSMILRYASLRGEDMVTRLD